MVITIINSNLIDIKLEGMCHNGGDAKIKLILKTWFWLSEV
jgi:hypothetical protein